MRLLFRMIVAIACAGLAACGSDGPTETGFSTEPQASSVPAYKIAYTTNLPATVVLLESGKPSRTIFSPTATAGASAGRPVWSPAGDRLAFRTITNNAQILFVWNATSGVVAQLDSLVPANACTKGQCTVIETPFSPAWSADGSKLAFLSGGRLKIATFGGAPVTVVPSPTVSMVANTLHWSPDGSSLVFASGSSILSVPSSGAAEFSLFATGFGSDAAVQAFEFSPDGKTIAVAASANLYLRNLATGNTAVVPSTSFFPPAWSPDGSRVAFVPGYGSPIVVNRDGSSLRRVTSESMFSRVMWLPDGVTLAYLAAQSRGLAFANVEGGGVYLLGTGGTNAPSDIAVAWK